MSIAIGTYFLGGGGVVVANILALYAFDRSYTPPSKDKAGFTHILLGLNLDTFVLPVSRLTQVQYEYCILDLSDPLHVDPS